MVFLYRICFSLFPRPLLSATIWLTTVPHEFPLVKFEKIKIYKIWITRCLRSTYLWKKFHQNSKRKWKEKCVALFQDESKTRTVALDWVVATEMPWFAFATLTERGGSLTNAEKNAEAQPRSKMTLVVHVSVVANIVCTRKEEKKYQQTVSSSVMAHRGCRTVCAIRWNAKLLFGKAPNVYTFALRHTRARDSVCATTHVYASVIRVLTACHVISTSKIFARIYAKRCLVWLVIPLGEVRLRTLRVLPASANNSFKL